MANWRQHHGGNPAGTQSMNRQSMSKFAKANTAFAVFDTAMNMSAGDDFGTAALKAGAGAALWAFAPWVMGAHLAATTLPMAGDALYNTHRQKVNQWNMQHLQGTLGGNYMDTQRALTMRQAAVQAIESSKMNARSALGGEAKILAQTWHK
ncbi:hypothetical protein [Niallia sp. 03133]|uniref:hypothetical protein n=1 Tax=Niallia sp. 03133 TaxID=3458060 RepID=UPI004043CB10